MNQTRGFLYILLAVFTFLLFQAYTQDTSPQHLEEQKAKNQSLSQIVPTNPKFNLDLNNGLLKLTVNTLDGSFVNGTLTKYTKTVKDKEPLAILSATKENYLQVFGGLQVSYNNQKPAVVGNYTVKSHTGSSVTLQSIGDDGVIYLQTISLAPNSYVVNVKYTVENNSNSNVKVAPYTTFVNRQMPTSGIFSSQNIYGTNSSYAGLVTSTSDDTYNKVSYGSLEDNDFTPETSKTGWVAISQHFFVTAFIPEQNKDFTISSTYRPSDKVFFIGANSQLSEVNAHSSSSFENKYWIGPKLQSQLKQVANHLNLVVDYGWAFFLAAPLFWLISLIHTFVSNWGLTIIVLTLLVRLIIFPLSRIQFRNQALMRVLQPEIAAANERAGDDKMKRMVETQNVYKRYGASQFAGCLPALIQMPIFISLYYMINEAVELRHQPFFGWIQDLSASDPYFVLPIINGLIMIWMFSLTPMPDTMDPTQKKLMKMMPYFFIIFFLFLPAGLILYYIISNLITIGFITYYSRKIQYQYDHKLLTVHTVKASKTYERMQKFAEQRDQMMAARKGKK